MSGKTVTLTQGVGHSNISAASGPSNASGVVTFTVTDSTAETVTYTATDATDSVVVTATAGVTFTAPPASASQSTVIPSQGTVAADGASTSTITVTLKTAGGNAVSGKAVTLRQGNGHSVISAASDLSNASGVVTFTVKDSTAEAVTYTATDTTDSVAVTAAAGVTFTMPSASAGQSTVSASQGTVAADGTITSTITVTLKTAGDDAVSGKTVTLGQGSGHSVISAASGPSNASGVVTFTVKDSMAETVTYTATDTTDSVAVIAAAGVTFTAQSSGSNSPTREYIYLSGRTIAIENSTSQTAATPTFSPVAGSYSAPQTVAISSSTGAVICYNTTGSPQTNGSSGCTVGTLYTGRVPVSVSETLYAVAGGTGFADSAVGSARYTISTQAAQPTFSPVAGNYNGPQTVAISSSTGTIICYNTTGSPQTNGSSGCTVGTLYTGRVPVSVSETLYAVAGGTGFADSAVGSAGYTISTQAAQPTFSPGTGTYLAPQTVAISSSTGATICYNTTGSPKTNGASSCAVGTLYTGQFLVSASETLYAVAGGTGFADSTVSSAGYSISPESVNTPNTPYPISSGTTFAGTPYSYGTGGSVSTYNSEVVYEFAWGDGNYSGWLPLVTTVATYSWQAAGTFMVTAQASSVANPSVKSSSSAGLAVTMADPTPAVHLFTPANWVENTCTPMSGQAGTSQQFTFQVLDYAGASAVTFAQPFLSASSNLSNLTNSCHLWYQASTNTLSLDDSSGDGQFTNMGYGTQGGAGPWVNSNNNGICQVNSWSATSTGEYLVLSFSLTFQVPGTWYYFGSTTNAAGNSPWVTNYSDGCRPTWTATAH